MRDIGINDHIDERARKREKAIIPATVTKVYEKRDNKIETGNIEVDVVTQRVSGGGESTAEHKFTRVPVVCVEHPGHMSVPQVGDQVLINWVMGKGRKALVVGQTPTDEIERRSPNALAGHWRHEFKRDGSDSLYLEGVPEKESISGDVQKLRMGVKPGGLSKPTTQVEIDDSEPVTHVKVRTDGEITIETTDDKDINVQTKEGDVTVESEQGDIKTTAQQGNITAEATTGNIEATAGSDATVDASGTTTVDGSSVLINTDSGPTPVAKQNHTHDYEDEKSDGSKTTKQTSKPNESGTDTEIG